MIAMATNKRLTRTINQVEKSLAEYYAARRLEALRMREDENLTYQAIGERLGVGRQRAHAMVKQARREQAATAAAKSAA